MAEFQMSLMDWQRIARDTMAFWFNTNETRYEFRAGQHADFVFMDPSPESAGDNSRTFSLANSPGDKGLVMIALRMRQTGFKNALKAAALGTKFKVKGSTFNVPIVCGLPAQATITCEDNLVATGNLGRLAATSVAKNLTNTAHASIAPTATVSVALKLNKKARKKLQKKGRLKANLVTTNTYNGAQSVTNGPGGKSFHYTDTRFVAVGTLNSAPGNGSWLRISQNASTGNGGTCYGDSGGPNFLGAGAGETNIVAATTITGDTACRSTNVDYRLDSPSARAFLSQFVALP